MNTRFVIWASLLISSLIAMGLVTRHLAAHGISVSESLILRGSVCLILVVAMAQRNGLALWPRSPFTQVVRGLLAGLALTLLTLSYRWLSATTVSVLSNVDVPLLLVLGPWVGVSVSLRGRVLSLISVLFLLWYISGLEMQINLFYGLGSLCLGSVLLCFGYLFIKKSMQDENAALAILTPALALIAFGLAERLLEGSLQESAPWTFFTFGAGAFSGVGMFVAYIATMKLYELTDIASAEFPTLLSSILIQPLETLLLNEPMQIVYLTSTIGFVGLTYLIMKLPQTEEPLAA